MCTKAVHRFRKLCASLQAISSLDYESMFCEIMVLGQDECHSVTVFNMNGISHIIQFKKQYFDGGVSSNSRGGGSFI